MGGYLKLSSKLVSLHMKGVVLASRRRVVSARNTRRIDYVYVSFVTTTTTTFFNFCVMRTFKREKLKLSVG